MNKGSREIEKVYAILADEFKKHRTPVVDLIELQTNDPFKVLIATILSARSKDQTTSAVSQRLFERVKNFRDLDKLTEAELAKLIYPIGFYKTKAKHLKQLPKVIEKLFNGKIPQNVDDLVKLPGVGRKTANLVCVVAFKVPAVCVDVHVHRIFNRLGYLKTETPLQTEMELRRIFPQKYWTTFNSYFVSFGQHTCLPRNPKCDICLITKHCSRYARGAHWRGGC